MSDLKMTHELWDGVYVHLNTTEDDDGALVNVLIEAFVVGLLWRDGDELIGLNNQRMALDRDSQRAVRIVEDAIAAAILDEGTTDE